MPRSRSRRRGGQGAAPYADMQLNPQAARQAMDSAAPLVPFRRGVQIDVGDLSGEEVEPITASFGYFGETFRVNPDLTETMVVDLLEAGEAIEVDDPRQLVAAKQYVRDHIHPEDFDDFWATAVDHRQGVQAVIKVCWKILEQVTARPTSPPSDSSGGRRDTPTNSPGGASERVIESTAVEPGRGNLSEVAEHFASKFEDQGRPDLALQVMIAKESREARGLVTV